MQNKNINDDNGDGVDNSDDSANKHITHLSQADDCHLTERSKQTHLLLVIKTIVLTISLMTIVMTVPTSTSHISHKWMIGI